MSILTNTCSEVNPWALCRCHSVTVVEVSHFSRIERHFFAVVHLERDSTFLVEAFQYSKVAIGDLELTIRCCELKTTAHHPNPSENESAETDNSARVDSKGFERSHQGLCPREIHRSLGMCSCGKRECHEGWCESAYGATHGFFSSGCQPPVGGPSHRGMDRSKRQPNG